MSTSGPPAWDQCVLQRGREALHERQPRAQAASEAAGVACEMGANTARDLREDEEHEISEHLRGRTRKAARRHASKVQQEGLRLLHPCGRDC